MMKYFIIIMLLFIILTGCPPGNGESGYLITASHEVNSYGGSNTQVVILIGMSGVAGATVKLNDQTLTEQTFFVTLYTGTDLFVTLGEPVTLSITIDGDEIVNETLNIPDAVPVITACPDPFIVSINNTVSWTGPANVDAHELVISWGYTQTGDDYAPRFTPAGSIDHVIPLNTVEYDSEIGWFALDVNALNETNLTGENIKSGSTFKVYTNAWEMPATQP